MYLNILGNLIGNNSQQWFMSDDKSRFKFKLKQDYGDGLINNSLILSNYTYWLL